VYVLLGSMSRVSNCSDHEHFQCSFSELLMEMGFITYLIVLLVRCLMTLYGLKDDFCALRSKFQAMLQVFTLFSVKLVKLSVTLQ
jgi:hypothetical protein